MGVLLFLVWDVLSAAWEPIEAELTDGARGGSLAGLSALFVLGISTGLLSVVAYERFLSRRRAAAADGVTSSRSLATLVAIGIGVHNLAEGLAIGQSSASGALGLAAVLVIGFALHNATEGFGSSRRSPPTRNGPRGASCSCSAPSAAHPPSSAPRSAGRTPPRC